ncbi:MAG: ABC transporter permease [Candidatus Omnitrophica bacterium]|nr:ABC transporter permease [Candidatus Omnitrophota bacterium]MBU2043702.1 ABC transporter permease [Candidatus Omnitrophota bacterium]MBU2250830.1 ABC transporter permease [Candidatus Omnitrophota bacterium]MBU2265521.1 ABC transporter permease [Candidatus Omnitrophota bacterium]MBU2473251.1 ABC transporter permease [Candidatus Omnitrophota bacterium]
MINYIIRRLLFFIPLLLAVSFIGFVCINLAPGNYFDSLKQNPQVSQDTIRLYEQKYHLDQNVFTQYYYWLVNISKLDFGYSFAYKIPVFEVLKSRMFNTFILSLSVLLFSWLIAIPLGIYCAVNQYKFTDKLFSFFSFIGLSIPSFFFALLLLYFASLTGILPAGGMHSLNYEAFSPLGKFLDLLKHLIIPTLVIGTSSIAGLQRLMRGNMLEVLRAQYITTARAKGLPEYRVIYLHAVRNAINPMVTIFGGSLAGLLSGAALTEIICNWPGLGRLMLDAVMSQDLFLFAGDLLMISFLLILGYLIADIVLAWVDPRIQYQ